MSTAGSLNRLGIFKALIGGLNVLHAYALYRWAADPDSFRRTVSHRGDLVLPWAIPQAELHVWASFSDAGTRLGWCNNIRIGLFGAALIIGLALLAAKWVPVLEPFPHWAETHCHRLLRLVA